MLWRFMALPSSLSELIVKVSKGSDLQSRVTRRLPFQ